MSGDATQHRRRGVGGRADVWVKWSSIWATCARGRRPAPFGRRSFPGASAARRPAGGPGDHDGRLRRPFTESGVCITLLLTRLPYGGGWLYAADLAGAALGCLGVIFVLLVIDPVSATLGIGALAAGAGWTVVRGSGDIRSLRLSGAVALTLAAATVCKPDLMFPAKAISACSGPRGPSRLERCSSAGIPIRASG